MKKNLLLFLSLLISTIAIAQTTWTGAGANTNWNNTDNWSTNLVPTASDDVIIPTGFTVTLNVAGSVRSINVQGTSVFEMNTSLTFTEPSTFGVNTTVNWNGGTLNGTTSTLTTAGLINLTGTGAKIISGDTNLNNSGTVNITSNGDLFITQGIFNNLASGVLDLQADGGDITWSGGSVHVLNNFGLIKKSTSDGEAQIVVLLNNNDGIIQVESGTLSFQNAIGKNLNDGTYNVFTGAVMDWDTTMTLTGTIAGTIEGTLNWTNIVNVATATTATIDFTGTGNVNWVSGSLAGGGELTHNSTLNLAGTGSKSITGDTTLNNFGTVNITSSGDLLIVQGVFNNLADGVLDLQADGGDITWFGGDVHVLNNSGLIKKTTSAGEAQIVVLLNNNDGIIQVESGTLSFQNDIGKNLNDGTYNVFTGAVMDWDTTMTLTGTIAGTIDGNLNWNNVVNVATTATIDFTGTGNVNWVSGSLAGGGELNHNSTLNLTGFGSKIITSDTTLNNSGTVNITSSGNLLITQGIFNNLANGVLDLQADGGNITWSGGSVHVLNNSGLIKRTTTTGEAQIVVLLNNNDGIIQVESGTLSFQDTIGKNFNDGTYNVSADAVMDWDTTMTLTGTIAGTIDGNLNWNNVVNVVTTASMDFTGTGNVNWVGGSLAGGGELNHNSTLNLTGFGAKIITGDTTLNNSGIVNIISSGDLFITQGIFNNLAGGVLDLQADSGNITWSGGGDHILNNSGLIKRTATTGEAQIIALLNNNDGIIQVESGTLSFLSIAKNLNDGIYNVFNGAVMSWDTTMTLTGTIAGTIDGNLNWNNVVNVVTTASMDFTGAGNVNWVSGSLAGGGELNHNSTLNLPGFGAKIITGDTTLNNSGTVNIISSGDLLITQGIFNNLADGVLDLQADSGNLTWSGGNVHILNNFGLIKRSTTNGLVQSFVELNNFGTIEVITGELEITSSLPFTNSETGIIKGIGIFDLPPVASYTNNGTFAPGLSPGTLNVQGDFKSTTTSVLDIELNGLIPDTEHDVLAIEGNNNIFEGVVNVTMGFEGTIGDAFTVATTTGTIATANLQSPIENVDFDGKRYTFEVSYPDNNKVVLTITDKLDILPPNVITQNITVQLDNTGNVSIIPTDIDNGSTDNCTPTNELQFSLDVDSFTCDDLGENTVNLTVTDNDGNFATAPATVIVEDVTAPTAVSQNITFQLDASGNASITAAQIDNGSSDNCAVSSLSLDVTNFTCADLGANTVELTVTDQSGNSATAMATVTVQDATAPTVVTQNITVQLDASGNASVTVAQIDNGSSDNCTVSSLSLDVADFTCEDLGDNIVELTATDQSGNSGSATATITVEDATAPTVVTQNVTIQLDTTGNASITAAQINNGSTDNCTVSSLSLDMTDFTCDDLGANTVELTVTDQSGNSASAMATVTVEDVIAPTVVTQNIIIQLDNSGNASITPAQINNGSSDNCAVTDLSLDISDFTCEDLGENTVELTVTDQSGNSASAMATVTVEDAIVPTINCPSDFNVSSEGFFTLPDYVAENLVTADDNCSFFIVQTPAPGTELMDGFHTISFMVTDASGIRINCSFELEVNDTTLSIDNPELSNNTISIYPNPVKDRFTLKNTSSIELLSLEVFDISGKLVQKVNLTGMSQSQDILFDNYALGVYLVKVNSQNASIVKRIIKN